MFGDDIETPGTRFVQHAVRHREGLPLPGGSIMSAEYEQADLDRETELSNQKFKIAPWTSRWPTAPLSRPYLLRCEVGLQIGTERSDAY